MDSPKPLPPPTADELVRRILEGLVERTLAFAHGGRVPVQVLPAVDGLPAPQGGITVTLTTLQDARPALWVLPLATWEAWNTAWTATRRPEQPEVGEKALMLLLTGGLDRWQLLAGGPDAVPGFPFPGNWDSQSAEGWLRLQTHWQWFQVKTSGQLAWVGLSPTLMKIGKRLLSEPALRAQLREEVLGEACGRLGSERPWEPSSRGPLELRDSFIFGPCLLPVLGSGEEALVPKFHRADPGTKVISDDELLIRHEFGWDGKTFSTLYRTAARMDRASLAELMAALAGRLLPFAALAARPAGPELWEIVAGQLPSTESWLTIEASHIPDGPRWEVLLSAELLNALSSAGTQPWSWVWLSAGADNLLRVFLQVNDRFRLGPPAGFGDRTGLDWSIGWYAQTGQDEPPPVTMTIADLLAVANPQDRVLLVQNVLVPEASLQPLQGLFTWVEDDPASGATPFQLAGFDRAGFRMLLAGRVRDAWDAGGMVIQTREELRDRNTRALEVVWSAWAQGRLVLSQPAQELLQVGFADVQKSWRERRARERTGRGLAPHLVRLKARKDLGAILQRPGPRSLALALLYDAQGAEKVSRLCTRRFFDEFTEQQKLWRQAFESTGPDLAVFLQALERIETELATGPEA